MLIEFQAGEYSISEFVYTKERPDISKMPSLSFIQL
jgi:hypothetical protein